MSVVTVPLTPSSSNKASVADTAVCAIDGYNSDYKQKWHANAVNYIQL